jgi:hypothetical protein
MPNVQTIDIDIDIEKLDRKANHTTTAAILATILGVWGVVWTSGAPGTQWLGDALTGLAFVVGVRLTIRAAVLKSRVAIATALNDTVNR